MQNTNNSQQRFDRALQALELNRHMQRDWVKYGIDFIDSYVEDVDGDWLAIWGEKEALPEQKTKISLLTKNTAQMPQLFSQVRSVLEQWKIKPPENVDIDRLINKIIDELARIISSTDSSEWLYETADTLEQVLKGKSELDVMTLSRSTSEQDNEDWSEIAEDLLEEVKEFWEISEI